MSPMKFNHKVDGLSAANVSLDQEHHEVHDGNAYEACFYGTASSGGETLFYIQTPNTTKRAHMKFVVSANLGGISYLTEGFTISGTTAGTSVTIYNFDRNSTNTSACLAFHTPVVATTAYGTVIAMKYIGGGFGQGRMGGDARSNFEFICKQNEKYMVRFIADTNGTRVVSCAEWYEE